MQPPDDATNPRGDGLETAIQARLDALEAGNTRRGTRTALDRFATYLRRERGVDDLEDLDVQDCRRWAQALRRDVHDDERLAASTAQQYYARVRASCTWWVEDGRLDTNPAKRKRAESELPEDTTEPDRQSWSSDQREQLLRHTDRAVDEVLDEKADDEADVDDQLQAYRDRALAYLLAWSGVRGAEVLRDPSDKKRDGVQWRDVDGDGVLRLLGKTRKREAAPLRDPVQTRLSRWQRVLDPPSEDWPVFPVLNKGALRRDIEERVDDLDLASDASVRERLNVYVDEGLVPPALSTNGGRGVMQRLSEAAEVDVDEGYLQPHGGRRGLGDQIYEKNPVAAQDTLRHESIETTNKAYREKRQAERASQLDEMFSTNE